MYGKGNRLLRKGNTDYEWDPDGNLIAKHTRDPENGECQDSWVQIPDCKESRRDHYAAFLRTASCVLVGIG